MQNFWQRGGNYLVAAVVSFVVSKPTKAEFAAFGKQTGRHFGMLQDGASKSAALISTADWAIEFPFPVPPRIHVCPSPSTAAPLELCTSSQKCRLHEVCSQMMAK